MIFLMTILSAMSLHAHNSKDFDSMKNISAFMGSLSVPNDCLIDECLSLDFDLSFEIECGSHIKLQAHKYDRKSRSVYVQAIQAWHSKMTCSKEPTVETVSLEVPNIQNNFLKVYFIGTEHEFHIKKGQTIILQPPNGYVQVQ